MDSVTNIALLDEDDSLLCDDSAPATADVFSCSPLIPLRSNPPQTEGGPADSESRISSVINSANKENEDWNKPQKLRLEPHQMKRKKKGGGYNLRKSLAWNRAFFTEEGVLNPEELSMISGTASAKAGLDLEVIHEEEYVGTSIQLQEIEENLFMHSSDAVPVEDRKIGAASRFSPQPPAALAKASPAPVSLAKRKILTVNDSVGNRPKRNACPPRLPVASSSLKRPNTVKAPTKEVKVARTPGPKLDVSASTTTARSGILTAGFSKRNQNAHPATNLQKHAGVKALSKDPKTIPSNPKVGPADKRSVTTTLAKRAGKHLDNSVKTHPPPSMLQSGTEANKLSETCLPRVVSDISEKKQETQLQTTKLSGLRMPSPSLGFFSMAKAPSSHSQLHKISKPCKPARSNIPKLQNLETNSVNEARTQHAHVIRSEVVEGKNCIEELSLLDVKSELSMQVHNKQMAGVEVKYNSLEKISKQEKVENILGHDNITYKEHGELRRSKNASSVEDAVFPGHKKKLLSESHTQVQLEKEAGQPDVLSKGYPSVLQESPSMHYHGMQGTSIVKGNISNTVHIGMGQDEDEQAKLLACDVLTSNESLVLQAKHNTSFKDSRLSGEFSEYNSVKTALLNSSLLDFSETALEGSIQEIHYKRNTEQVNGGAVDLVKSGGDAQKHLLNGNLSVNCSETTGSNLEAVNQQLQREQLKTTSASMVGEIMSTKESESHLDSCQLVHMTTLSSKGSLQKSTPEIKCAAAGEPKIAKIEGSQLSVDYQSGFIQTKPVLEQCDKVIDSKVMDHSAQVFELDRMTEDCITVSATTCNTEVTNVSQESRPFHEDNVQNLLTSQECPMVKADFVSSENEMSTNNHCTISELQLRGEDVSIHYDVPYDVPGNFEQQTSKITYSKSNKMLCDDESLVLNHGHLLDQSEFSEVSADNISSTKDFIGSGAEKSSSCLRHTLLTQLLREVDHINREIKESHVEDAQMQLLNENPAPYKSNNPENGNNILHSDGDWLPSNIGSSEEIKKAVEDVHARSFNENLVPFNCNTKHCLVTNDTDFQGSGAVGGADSDNVNSILLHLNGNRLSTHVAPSDEIKKTNLFEDTLCDIYTSEHNASNNHIRAMPENKDGNILMDDLLFDDAKEDYSNILPSVEFQLNDNIQTMSENKDGNLDMDDLQVDDAKEGPSDMFPLVEVQVSDNIQDMSENNDGNLDMDDSKECSSDILPLVEVQLIDNIQAISGNNDENLDIDDGKECFSDLLPLVEVQLDDNIQAMSENNERYLGMDDLQMDDAKEGSSDMLPLVEVQVSDNILDVSENNDGNLDMDDSKECSSDILPCVEVQLIDNIQAISENNYENLDMDDAKEGSSDILPLVEVQLDDNIQAMSENNERNLAMDDLQMDYAKEGSSDMFPLVEVQVSDNIQDMSENNDGNLDMDDSKECSSDILPLVEVQLIDNIESTSGNNDENHGMDDAKGSSGILPLVEVQVNDNIIASERISSAAVNQDSFADVVAWKSEERCSLSESSNLPASDHLPFNLRIPQVCELSSLNSKKNSDEFPDTDVLYQSKGGIYFAEESRKIIHLQESAARSKQEVHNGKLAPNAARFSDEWFTAIDSAGQKLNQNSPHGDRPETVACDTELRDDGSSRDASMQHHVYCDVTGNTEQQTSIITYSKAEEMLCEYESLELNHDHLVDQSEFSEVSADFISNTKDYSIGSGAEKPSGHIQHSLFGQFVNEFNQTNGKIEESHLTTQVQSLTENPVLYNCNSKQCLAVSDDKFPLAYSDSINENSQLSDFKGPCAVVGVDSQNVDNIQLHLDGNWLSTNIASSEENKKTNLSEHALKGCYVRTGEYNTSNDHIQALPKNEDGNLYADERAEPLQMNDAKKDSSDILALVEVQFKDKGLFSECNSFIEASKDSFTDVFAWKPEEHRSSESSSLPASDNLASNTRVPQVCEISLLNTTTFSEEAGTNTDMEHRSKGDIYFAEDSNKIIHLQESATKSKQEVPTLKPPPNAAPFSDEWLAAIEAAGEEILTMKGGAVQNSPTDKPQHELGPWSPVRRKNQSIGPFDCTKHHTLHSSS